MSKQEEASTAGFVFELPALEAEPAEFRFTIPEGDRQKAMLRLRAADGSRIQGRVTADSHRIVLAGQAFSGYNNEILFGVDTKGLRAGDTVEGVLLVSCGLAEREIPVHAEITGAGESDYHPDVRTLDDFSRLCQKSLREGFLTFTGPDFPGILNGNNRQYMALYRGMSTNPVTYQHLEEFLVTTGKKEPLEFSLDRQEKAVYHLDVPQKDTLYIYKNTWGYVRLEIETEGAFLTTEKTVLTGEDFIGKVCGLEYIVDPEHLSEGRSCGKIRIRSVHQVLEYTVEASRGGRSPIRPAAVRSRRIAWLMRDFLDLQLHRIDYRSWQESASMTVQDMLEEDPQDSLALLYKAYLEYSREENGAAIETLWPIKDGQIELTSLEERGFYLTVAKAVGLLPEERMDIRHTLRKYYRQQKSSCLLLRLLHQEQEPLRPAEAMQEYERCFESGCTSPFLYLEAWNLLKSEEALLRRLSPFMIQVLAFAQKRGLITQGLLQRAAFLSGNQKFYSAPIYRLLARGYETFPNDDILEAVCKLIIKGSPARPEYFVWYQRAVDRELRITRLYEYYMETYSAPAAERLPLAVLMYFATNNTLGEKKKALLYASIVLHKEEDETSYLNYTRNMRAFALEALKAGRIDENYAVLYQEYFGRPDSLETAEYLTKVMFAVKVTTSDPTIRRVAASHAALKQEPLAVFVDGTAYPCVYSEDACIILEDEKRRRYASTIPFQVKPLMKVREIASACERLGVDDAGLSLYLCHEKAFRMEITSRSAALFYRAVRNDAFTDAYRATLRRKLVDYVRSHAGEIRLPEEIEPQELEAFAEADKAGTVAILVTNGRYREAFFVLSEYGYEAVPPEQLAGIAGQLIRTRADVDQEELLCLAACAFHENQFDEDTLGFLKDNYQGSVRNLCRLWKKLQGTSMETVSLEERILRQCIETHQFPDRETDILKSCIRQGGSEKIIQDFLVYLSEYYFLGGRQTSGAIFRIMGQEISEGRLDQTVCALALLKYYSEVGTVSEEQEELGKKLIRQMDEMGLRFEFYSALPDRIARTIQIEDKVFIQEQLRPDSRVMLHYQLSELGGDVGEWQSEPMENVYRGIFVREFLLFYGEVLTYYLTVTDKEGTRNTDTYQISLVDMDTSGNTRYKLLNRMLEARDQEDDELLEETMDRYLMQDAFSTRLLHLITE